MSDVTSLDDPTTDPFEVARAAAGYIARATGVPTHDVALVLGSGWGGAAELLGETVAELPSHEVPGFSAPAVVGHVGTIRSIRIEGTDKHALVLGQPHPPVRGPGRPARGARRADRGRDRRDDRRADQRLRRPEPRRGARALPC